MKSFQIFARLDYVTFTKDLQCVLIQYLYYTLDWHYWSIQCWFNIWDSFDCFPYHLTLLITALCVSLPCNSCVGSGVMRAWRQLWGARARSEQGWAEWRSEHGQEKHRRSMEPAQKTKTCDYKSVKTNILINYRRVTSGAGSRGLGLSSPGRSLITRDQWPVLTLHGTNMYLMYRHWQGGTWRMVAKYRWAPCWLISDHWSDGAEWRRALGRPPDPALSTGRARPEPRVSADWSQLSRVRGGGHIVMSVVTP